MEKYIKKEDRAFREGSKAPLKKYTINGKTFTEEDFLNRPPVDKRSLEYKMAYADWADDNGLTIEFKDMDEVNKWFRDMKKKYNLK